MSDVITLLSGVCFLTGGFLCLTGGVGLLRLPDFFSRTHAAGVTETLATPLLLIGIILQLPLFSLESFKLILIMLFVLATNPTAAHAMAKAALHSGHTPLTDKEASTQQPGGDLSKP